LGQTTVEHISCGTFESEIPVKRACTDTNSMIVPHHDKGCEFEPFSVYACELTASLSRFTGTTKFKMVHGKTGVEIRQFKASFLLVEPNIAQ
jgi:hypothetical protein